MEITMNIIKSLATASFATCAAIALSVATSSEAQARYRTITGDIAGFRDVTAVDRRSHRHLLHPFTVMTELSKFAVQPVSTPELQDESVVSTPH